MAAPLYNHGHCVLCMAIRLLHSDVLAILDHSLGLVRPIYGQISHNGTLILIRIRSTRAQGYHDSIEQIGQLPTMREN